VSTDVKTRGEVRRRQPRADEHAEEQRHHDLPERERRANGDERGQDGEEAGVASLLSGRFGGHGLVRLR